MQNITLRLIRVISCIGASCLSLLGQATITESWQVQDPRPLQKAADVLELKYGLQINYEDPVYQFSGDWQDTGVQGKSWPALQIRKLAWSNSVPLPARSLPDPAAAIQSLIDQHKAASYPGEFKLVTKGGVYFILPNQVRDASGKWIAATSPMDMPITLPETDRSGARFLDDFCDTLSRSSGIKVEAAIYPMNYMMQTHVNAGASAESARDAFVRILGGLQYGDQRTARQIRTRKLSYKMIYSPAMKEYLMQVHLVTVEVPRPSGGYMTKYAENPQ